MNVVRLIKRSKPRSLDAKTRVDAVSYSFDYDHAETTILDLLCYFKEPYLSSAPLCLIGIDYKDILKQFGRTRYTYARGA